ncbi:MAG TPA: DUF4238 domain-containing protein [Firmicutes bacterium]|nr:DUF4238 domain-containing protein [Bacillota bacterium]
MERVKRQHYVPQFYLRKFTDNNGGLYVFDKWTGRSFKTTTENVANERYFYDFPQDVVQDEKMIQIVENTLSRVEAQFSEAVETILAELSIRRKHRRPDQRKILYKRDKEALAFFITLQIFRTREFRETWIEIAEKTAQAILEISKASNKLAAFGGDCRIEYNRDLAPLEQAGFMFNPRILDRFVAVFCKHIWLLGANRSERLLYSSDNPVVKRDHVRHPFFSYSGYGSPGIEIAFPLSPTVVLIMYERTYFKAYECLDGKVIPLCAENVDYYNSLQVGQSYRQIYSCNQDFTLVKEICKREPEVCSPDRQRIHLGR